MPVLEVDSLTAISHGVGTWTWEVGSDILFADPVAAIYFGIEPSEAEKGLPLERYLEAVHPDDRARVRTAISRAVEQSFPFDEVYRVTTLGGHLRRIAARGQCFRSRDGQPLVYPGTIVDVTDRHGIETFPAALRHNLDMASHLADYAGYRMVGYYLEMARMELRDTPPSSETVNEGAVRRH